MSTAAGPPEADLIEKETFGLVPIGVGVGVGIGIGIGSKLVKLDTDSDSDSDTEKYRLKLKMRETMDNTLKIRLGRGDLLVGTIVSLPSPEVAEILSHCGFDWLFIDMEHGAVDATALQRLLQAADSFTPCLVRPPGSEETWAKKCLDCGAAGIIVPRVQNAQEAEQAVRFAKYPPEGCRSAGLSRAHGYGAGFAEYVARANDEVLVVLQIEHIEAVNQIESIVRVPGIDALFIGPYDLSASMGKIGRLNDPQVQQAIERIRECALATEISLGIFAADADTARAYVEKGYRLVAVGMDGPFLATAAGKALAALRD